MSKITLSTVSELQAFPSAAANINSNSDILEAAIDNTLSRDGTNPNSMNANLDMNSNRILNLPTPVSNLEPARLVDLETLTGSGTITINPLPIGGTTAQVLSKNSNANFDAGWSTLPTFVSSIDGNTGAFTTGNGIDSSGSVIELTAARRTLPTRQTFTSGSGTYNRPANCLYIVVKLVGGGGGGGGSGTSGAGVGGTGGTTSFSTLSATGGVGGSGASITSNAGGTGGSASGGSINLSGQPGGGSFNEVLSTVYGGIGGGSAFFGGGSTNNLITGAGGPAVTNTGGGGGGAAMISGNAGASGGGGGGSCEGIILSPAATYSYAVGAAGAAGTAGTSGSAGGVGAAGMIIVDEYYGS
jgi:hypothetical protein